VARPWQIENRCAATSTNEPPTLKPSRETPPNQNPRPHQDIIPDKSFSPHQTCELRPWSYNGERIHPWKVKRERIFEIRKRDRLKKIRLKK